MIQSAYVEGVALAFALASSLCKALYNLWNRPSLKFMSPIGFIGSLNGMLLGN